MVDQLTEPCPARWAPRFFTIWIGQAFSLLGSMLVQFALVWWLTQTTGSATVLATATLVAVLPGIFIGPVAGALVDRFSSLPFHSRNGARALRSPAPRVHPSGPTCALGSGMWQGGPACWGS